MYYIVLSSSMYAYNTISLFRTHSPYTTLLQIKSHVLTFNLYMYVLNTAGQLLTRHNIANISLVLHLRGKLNNDLDTLL